MSARITITSAAIHYVSSVDFHRKLHTAGESLICSSCLELYDQLAASVKSLLDDLDNAAEADILELNFSNT